MLTIENFQNDCKICMKFTLATHAYSVSSYNLFRNVAQLLLNAEHVLRQV